MNPGRATTFSLSASIGERAGVRLAREANYDIHQLCENTRRWMAEHPATGPVVRNAEELRQLIAAKERQRAEQSALTLNEEPPRSEKV